MRRGATRGLRSEAIRKEVYLAISSITAGAPTQIRNVLRHPIIVRRAVGLMAEGEWDVRKEASRGQSCTFSGLAISMGARCSLLVGVSARAHESALAVYVSKTWERGRILTVEIDAPLRFPVQYPTIITRRSHGECWPAAKLRTSAMYGSALSSRKCSAVAWTDAVSVEPWTQLSGSKESLAHS